LVPRIAGQLIEELRQSSHRPKPSFAGRNLFVALRDEALPDVIALNRVLEPFLPILFRLAARGHWIQERRPVRSQRHAHIHTSHIPPAVAEELTLIASCNTEGEIQLELITESRGVSYTLRNYPEICEFVALVEQLEPERTWNGLYFQASASLPTSSQSGKFRFLRLTDGVVLTFTAAEWSSLKNLLSAAWAAPSLEAIREELTLAYGGL